MSRSKKSFFMVGMVLGWIFHSQAGSSVTQYGITWTFKGAPKTGQYANGDTWVVGPVTVVSITNEFHAASYQAEGFDGSMVNPSTDRMQGYDHRLSSYKLSLNDGLPQGMPVSKKNPLELAVNSSLISSVSWLLDEAGCPKVNVVTKTPRPTARSMAILTCVENAPPENSFRPPYCGKDKSARFKVSQLKKSLLKNLDPVRGVPDLKKMETQFAGPWVDHVNAWMGAMNHPSMHMPEYGREMNILIGKAMLMLQLDFDQLPGKPSKETLLMELVQLGIDLAGIADAGGDWPSDGGHSAGRKWPILFAGLMLGDDHMSSVGQWDTGFQEDLDTFYVSQADIDVTHSSKWVPDTRAQELWPYEEKNLGLPEWGIRHVEAPWRDNLHWSATYRENNNQQYTGWTLAALLMGQKEAWNHDVLFDYVDRATAVGHVDHAPGDKMYDWYVFGSTFTKRMWQTYRKDCGPMWTPDDPTDFYSPGSLK